MTKVVVHAGVCGFTVTVTAQKGRDKKVLISLETECEMVRNMVEEISALDIMSVFTRLPDNPVYRSAARHLKHVTCPVPCGILKAMEAEAGFAVKKDAGIIFLDTEKKHKDDRG